MTENLAKMPVKGILRKSSLTFIEHDDADLQFKLDSEKQTRVIVEPAPLPARKNIPETVDEKIRRDEFEMKRKMLQHQEGMTAHMAKKILSDDNIEEEIEANQDDDMTEENPSTEENAAETKGSADEDMKTD